MPASAGYLSCGVVAAMLLVATTAAAVAQAEFPYEREMLLDAKPMPGGKRVPILEIAPDGRVQVDLWCRSGQAMVEIAGDAIKFAFIAMPEVPCTPERAQADEETGIALSQVTQWRREGDVLVLVGPTTLRFRLSTH